MALRYREPVPGGKLVKNVPDLEAACSQLSSLRLCAAWPNMVSSSPVRNTRKPDAAIQQQNHVQGSDACLRRVNEMTFLGQPLTKHDLKRDLSTPLRRSRAQIALDS